MDYQARIPPPPEMDGWRWQVIWLHAVVSDVLAAGVSLFYVYIPPVNLQSIFDYSCFSCSLKVMVLRSRDRDESILAHLRTDRNLYQFAFLQKSINSGLLMYEFQLFQFCSGFTVHFCSGVPTFIFTFYSDIT